MVARPGTTYPVETFAHFSFRLDDARCTLRYADRQNQAIARRGRKLLVLRYTVTNRESHTVSYTPDLVHFDVLTAGGGTSKVTVPPSITRDMKRELGGGASATETVWMEVPSEERAPKLQARVAGSAPLRFELESFLKPMKEPFVAADGFTVQDELAVRTGQRVPISSFDVTVGQLSWESVKAPTLVPASGDRVLVATLTIDNRSPYPVRISQGVLVPELQMAGGDVVRPEYALLERTEDELAKTIVEPGKTTVVRCAMMVKADEKPAAVRLSDMIAAGRTVIVSL
jgi:hypothetical protein